MKFFTKEVKIALVAIVGIVVLFFGMNFLKGRQLFSSDRVYYARFNDVGGLSVSSPIYADGYQVGTVQDIIYNYDHPGDIIVKFGVDHDLRIPKGSSAEISSDLMGNLKMNILLANNPRERQEPGDTINGNAAAGLADAVGGMMPEIQRMLPKLDSILASVNALLADPALANSLHNVETISRNLTATTRDLNTLMASVNAAVPGVMQKADYALGKAGSAMDNADRMTANLASIDFQGTMQKVDRAMDNVDAITASINNQEGTLGMLIKDPTLYGNLNSTMRSADSLLVDLRSHPKRYVHFSIFGRKDK